MARSVKEKLDSHFLLPLNQHTSRENSCQWSMKKLTSIALKLCGFTAGFEFSLERVRMTVCSFAFQIHLSLPYRFRSVYIKDIDLNQFGRTNWNSDPEPRIAVQSSKMSEFSNFIQYIHGSGPLQVGTDQAECVSPSYQVLHWGWKCVLGLTSKLFRTRSWDVITKTPKTHTR